MFIQSSYSKPTLSTPNSRVKTLENDPPVPNEDGQPESGREIFTASNLIGLALLSGIGLAGAALGAYAGYSSGALAGLAGSIAGGAGGIAIAAATKAEKVGKGALLGALGGAIIGSSFGNTPVAIAMGVAGATLPVAGIYGLASGLSA